MRNKLCHLMTIFVMFKWYKLLHYKEIPPIYWMTLVYQIEVKFCEDSKTASPIFWGKNNQVIAFGTTCKSLLILIILSDLLSPTYEAKGIWPMKWSTEVLFWGQLPPHLGRGHTLWIFSRMLPYRFLGNVMTSITTLRTWWQNYNVLRQK